MEENKIQHDSVQEAVDYAIGRMLEGVEVSVALANIQRQTVKFTPREKVTVQQRIGDSLRQERLDLLGRAFVQGFITQQEWDQRAAAALSAATRADLAHLTLDLDEVKREEPKIVPHRHKACVDLPAVVTLMALAMFVGVMIGVILA